MKREVERAAFEMWGVRYGKARDAGRNISLGRNPGGVGQLITISESMRPKINPLYSFYFLMREIL